MNWLKQLFSRPRLYSDLSEEIQAHLDEKVAELVAGGMSREEAMRSARREFGNVGLIEEDCRDVWAWPSVENVLFDVRYGLRMLAASPGFTAVALLSLGLAISIATSAFSELNAVLLRDVPAVGQPGQLVALQPATSFPAYDRIRRRMGMAGVQVGEMGLTPRAFRGNRAVKFASVIQRATTIG